MGQSGPAMRIDAAKSGGVALPFKGWFTESITLARRLGHRGNKLNLFNGWRITLARGTYGSQPSSLEITLSSFSQKSLITLSLSETKLILKHRNVQYYTAAGYSSMSSDNDSMDDTDCTFCYNKTWNLLWVMHFQTSSIFFFQLCSVITLIGCQILFHLIKFC